MGMEGISVCFLRFGRVVSDAVVLCVAGYE